ncbi:toxin-antitoxin system YwqK family antitoxin [Ochrovirga pacifica]|uniref:toxin-antitoxin system YwqK family antitoxin n=1 Tax=Ochrovirga pacifica TaxID=1042376 RepID=UPI000255A7F5|nr:hypothetical protein [Ochrovirga pacifica]
MNRVILIVGLFIGFISYGQEITSNKEEQPGIYKATVYHDNGEIAQTGFITLDKKVHGVWKAYDVNGNLKSLGEYAHGKKVGTWIFWDGKKMNKHVFTRVDYDVDSQIAKIYKSTGYAQIAEVELDE